MVGKYFRNYSSKTTDHTRVSGDKKNPKKNQKEASSVGLKCLGRSKENAQTHLS